MSLQSLTALLQSVVGVSQSSPTAPLQMGVPGGPELLIIGIIAILLFGIPLVLIAIVGFLWLRNDDDDYEERIRELESDIASLQAEIASGDSNHSDSDDSDSR